MASPVRIIRGAAILAVASAAVGFLPFSSSGTVAAVADDDWLGIVNTYRAMSGVSAITENATWSSEAYAHSCYMLYNGISHDEVPGNPGYTPGGDLAGNSGNIAVSSSVSATPRNHIDLWMTGPFHAIGVLRHSLRQTGFGLCSDPNTSPWRSGATLDVLRGIDHAAPRPGSAIVFPGRNATIPLTRFITEAPNPMALCNWSGEAGLPLIAMMPAGVGNASAALSGPSGPIETCVLHAGNTGADATARSILQSENAVVVMPRAPLEKGTHTATVSSDGGSVTWSFNVDPNAPLSSVSSEVPTVAAPSTSPIGKPAKYEPVTPYRYADSRVGQQLERLTGGQRKQVNLGDPSATAVSANFTVDRPAADGFLTVYNCTAGVPVVSTLNFTAGAAVANQAVVPLTDGALCLYSPVDTDVIIDVNGLFKSAGASTFVPTSPARLYDTRDGAVARLAAGEFRRIKVEGVPGGAPGSAIAVAVNLTAVGPADFGFLTAYPCDNGSSAVSNVNFRPGENRPNSALVPTAADGTICILSNADTDLLVDINGYFAKSEGQMFTALQPTRLLDTRSQGGRLVAGEVLTLPIAGQRGVPQNARAVSVNLTAVDPAIAGFVTAFPCGARPEVSNLNTSPGTPAIANGAMVRLSGDGELCLYADHAVHLLVDINGMWS